MRYDEKRGVYRDCKWCGGKGCVHCPAEADLAYKREFPDGPKPIATFRGDEARLGEVLKSLLGPASMSAAAIQASEEAQRLVSDPLVNQFAEQMDIPIDELKETLANSAFPKVLARNIQKRAQNP